MSNFSKFKMEMNQTEIEKQVEEAAKASEEVADGEYVGYIEKMEIGLTKAPERPMFKLQFRITEGDQKKKCLFMNRVIYGCQSGPATDLKMIANVQTFVNKLLLDDEEPIKFNGSYDDFNDDILDVHESLDKAQMRIEYTSKAFNPIKFIEYI